MYQSLCYTDKCDQLIAKHLLHSNNNRCQVLGATLNVISHTFDSEFESHYDSKSLLLKQSMTPELQEDEQQRTEQADV